MVLVILQARFSSNRLPGKVLADVCGEPMLVRQIERVQKCKNIDDLVLATSEDQSDDPIVDCGIKIGVPTVRGPLDDVLGRFCKVLEKWPARDIVRLTGDCPLTDTKVIDECVNQFLETSPAVDYLSNTLVPTFPDGLDVEVVRSEVLQIANAEARLPSEREHVTPFIYKRPERFRLKNYLFNEDLSAFRWTVDEAEDLEFVRAIYEELYPVKPDFTMSDILVLLKRKPGLCRINQGRIRNEGYIKSLQDDMKNTNRS